MQSYLRPVASDPKRLRPRAERHPLHSRQRFWSYGFFLLLVLVLLALAALRRS